MAINGVNGVSFRGENEQQRRTSGMLFPVTGLLAGGGITAFTKYGKSGITLTPELTADEFTKAVENAKLEGADKTKADEITAYLKGKETTTNVSEQPSTPSATPNTSAPAQTANPIEEATKKYEQAGTNYKNAKEILDLQQAHTNKIHNVYQNIEGATRSGNALITEDSPEYKGLKAQAETLSGQIDELEKKLKNKNLEQGPIKTQIAELEAELDRVESKILTPAKLEDKRVARLAKKAQQEAEEATKALNEVQVRKDAKDGELTRAKNAVEEADKNLKAAKTETTPDAAKIQKLEETLNKAKEDQAKLEKEVFDLSHQLETERIKSGFKSELQQALEIKDPKARTAALDKLYAKQIGIVNKEGKEGSAVTSFTKMGEEHQNAFKELQNEIKDADKTAEFKRTYAADLEKLGISAPTAPTGPIKPPTGAAVEAAEKTAEKEAVKIPENITKAFGEISEKLPKKFSWKGIGIGAAIGLGAGIIAKVIADGSHKDEA